MKQWVRY